MKTSTPLKTFRLFWSPEGKKIAVVHAKDARAACRKAPMPYRKFLGEIYAEEICKWNQERYKLVLVSPSGLRSDSRVKGAGMLSLSEAQRIVRHAEGRLKAGWRYEIELVCKS